MTARSLATLGMTVLFAVGHLSAQDTTQAYPWRLSYFPYVTTSPNDGVMAMGRAVLFQQSRWDARSSVDKQVAVEGGYSTRNGWLMRARGDFPRLAEGWRLQAIIQADKEPDYFSNGGVTQQATRQLGAIELTRALGGPFLLAARGEGTHVGRTFPAVDASGNALGKIETSSTDFWGRIAIVVDQRDHEYDTRAGTLLQGGFFIGSTTNSSSTSYHGEYGLASVWVPLGPTTRFTARAGARFSDHLDGDAARVIPAWEDDLLVVGGPESNRALPIASQINNCVKLASAEIRHDLKVFPGGAVAVLAFIDGSQADDCGRDHVTVATPSPGSSLINTQTSDWIFGPGGGVALRLLRNAVLTATVARARGATRVYVSSGWAW